MYTRIISSKLQQKNIVMSFKPYTEKLRRKNWNLFDFRSDPDPEPDPDPDPSSRKRIRGSGSASK